MCVFSFFATFEKSLWLLHFVMSHYGVLRLWCVCLISVFLVANYIFWLYIYIYMCVLYVLSRLWWLVKFFSYPHFDGWKYSVALSNFCCSISIRISLVLLLLLYIYIYIMFGVYVCVSSLVPPHMFLLLCLCKFFSCLIFCCLLFFILDTFGIAA